MTFEEATKFKNSMQHPIYLQEGIEFSIHIVPEKIEDFREYAHYIKTQMLEGLVDSSAKKYSSNNRYKVFGLYIHNYDLFYKDIKP